MHPTLLVPLHFSTFKREFKIFVIFYCIFLFFFEF